MNLESFIKSSSLWGAIEKIESFPFFIENPPLKMDELQVIKYGDRTMFNKIIKVNIDDLARSIISIYGDYWKNLIKVDISEFNTYSNGTRKLVENIEDEENRTNNRNDVNKISAFNTDDLINDTGLTSDNNDNLKGKKTRTLLDENLSLNSAYQNLSLIQKSNIINVVLKDVSNHLTLDIY